MEGIDEVKGRLHILSVGEGEGQVRGGSGGKIDGGGEDRGR